MPTIRKLPPQVAAKIAAGEVVERPASIVKELLENSLDAAATELRVQVRKGGIESIDVRDNGHGIAADQLALAVENHTTSKITAAPDLHAIHSLGFRGEALASIGAVSHLTVTSRAQGTDQSWQIKVPAGVRQGPRPAAMNQGTWVRVEELFHNVPARRKFLRSPATEFAQVEKVFSRIALSRPDLSFSLIHNDKLIHQVAATNKESMQNTRLPELINEHFSSHSVRLDSGQGSCRVHGWIIQPAHASTNASTQYLYINGRFVRDRILSHAGRQGYGELLFGRHSPAYILFIDMPAADVDVNVHPAKHEVRFRDGRLVHSLVSNSIRKRLAQITPTSINLKPSPIQEIYPEESPRTKQGVAEEARHIEQYLNRRSARQAISPNQQAAEEFASPLGTAIGLLHGIYIIAMNDTGLLVVDAHAAHERILFEQLRDQWRRKEWEIQTLLFPFTAHLSCGDLAYVEENLAQFAQWGFELRIIGITTVVIKAIPALLAQDQLEEMLCSLCQIGQEHQADGDVLTTTVTDEIFSSMACYGAVRANRRMTIMEMNALLRQLEKTPRNYACNHGRPTWIQIDRKHLDKELLHGQ